MTYLYSLLKSMCTYNTVVYAMFETMDSSGQGVGKMITNITWPCIVQVYTCMTIDSICGMTMSHVELERRLDRTRAAHYVRSAPAGLARDGRHGFFVRVRFLCA